MDNVSIAFAVAFAIIGISVSWALWDIAGELSNIYHELRNISQRLR